MGTCNFSVKNASKIYVVQTWAEMNDEEPNQLDWSERIDEILSNGIRSKWMQDDKRFGHRQDVDGMLLKTFEFEYSTSNIKYELDAYICLNYGYYTAANLDYRFVLDGEDQDAKDVIEMIVDDFVNDYHCGSLSYEADRNRKTWNIGLRKIHEKNFRKALEKFIEDIAEECEQFCRENSNSTYIQIGRASNGEGFYEKVC